MRSSSSCLSFFVLRVLSSLLPLECVIGDVCSKPVCEFDFVITRKQTMTYVHRPGGRTFNVALNGSSLVVVTNGLRSQDSNPDVIGMTVDPRHVITADGFPRDVIVVNGQFPGPTIEVLEGSQIVVRVSNSLMSEVTSIHWHGMRMRDNYFMDGVPYVTQCPIIPGQSFVYRFRADPQGTHWYHSHHSNQRTDGLYGLLVVHPRSAAHPRPFHGIFVTDWCHLTADEVALRSGTSRQGSFTGELMRDKASRYRSLDGVEMTSLSYVSSLLGGRGRYDERPFPLEVYTLIEDQGSHFRLVNAAGDFSFEISADDHRLNITSLDGFDIQPITVDSAIVNPGEAIDFEIIADQVASSRYWLRAKTLLEGEGPTMTKSGVGQEARAILEYRGFVGVKDDPRSEPRPCTEPHPCVVFNCPFQEFPANLNKSCRHVHTVNSRCERHLLQSEYGLTSENPEEFFLNFAFVVGSSVNGRRFVLPRGFDGKASNWKGHMTSCDEKSCKERTCPCTNILSLPLNVTVQMVIMNYQPVFDSGNQPSHHSVHIHGHAFAILGLGFGIRNASNGIIVSPNTDISCDGSVCSNPDWTSIPSLNFANPPIKDTILVPAQGYVVIRFRTDNPGRWMAHCHQELHFLKGMGIILEEGAAVHHPQPPAGFPTCGDFTWTDEAHDLENEQTPIPRQESRSTETSRNTGAIALSLGTAVSAAFGFLLLGAIVTLFTTRLHRFLSKEDPRQKHGTQTDRTSQSKNGSTTGSFLDNSNLET